MAKEPENFRIVLEEVNGYFPQKAALTVDDIAEFIGKSACTARRHFVFVDGRILKSDFAWQYAVRMNNIKAARYDRIQRKHSALSKYRR